MMNQRHPFQRFAEAAQYAAAKSGLIVANTIDYINGDMLWLFLCPSIVKSGMEFMVSGHRPFIEIAEGVMKKMNGFDVKQEIDFYRKAGNTHFMRDTDLDRELEKNRKTFEKAIHCIGEVRDEFSKAIALCQSDCFAMPYQDRTELLENRLKQDLFNSNWLTIDRTVEATPVHGTEMHMRTWIRVTDTRTGRGAQIPLYPDEPAFVWAGILSRAMWEPKHFLKDDVKKAVSCAQGLLSLSQ